MWCIYIYRFIPFVQLFAVCKDWQGLSEFSFTIVSYALYVRSPSANNRTNINVMTEEYNYNAIPKIKFRISILSYFVG